MRYVLIFFLSTSSLLAISQERKEFKVQITIKNIANLKNDYKKFINKSEYLFEDENYIITDTCRGEFGGNIYFINKKTNSTTIALSTCSSAILKKDNKYYLTVSLAHLNGTASIYEISNPDDLIAYTNNLDYYGKRLIKQSNVGLKKLYDTFGKTILLTFIYDDTIYYLISGKNGVFIANRKHSKLIYLQKILDKRIITYKTRQVNTVDNEYITDFQSQNSQGIIVVKDDVITINIYK